MMQTVKVTAALVQQALRNTDWAAIDAQSDEDIARNVASDPDAAPIHASDGFWTYQASEPTPDFAEVPPDAFNGTREGWESLSPGMRREIVRPWKKNQITKEK